MVYCLIFCAYQEDVSILSFTYLILWVQKWKYIFWLQEMEAVTQLFLTCFKISVKTSSSSPHSTQQIGEFLSGNLELAHREDWPFSFGLPRVRLLISSEQWDYEPWCTDFPRWELIYIKRTSGYSSEQSPLLAALFVYVQRKTRIPLLEISWDAYSYESKNTLQGSRLIVATPTAKRTVKCWLVLHQLYEISWLQFVTLPD